MWGSKATSLFLLGALILLGSPAHGALILFDDRDEFMEALAVGPLAFDGFEDLENGYYADQILRSEGTLFEYAMGSSSIVGLMALDGLISTVLPKSMIQVETGPGVIQAVGGDFGLVDYNGASIPGDILIRLQDNSYVTRYIDATTSFVGVIGIGENVMSLHVGAAANAPLVTMSSLVIAATPAPGAWPLAIGAIMLLGRSRRRHSCSDSPMYSFAK